MFNQKKFLFYFFCLLLLNACSSKKDLIYFSDINLNNKDKIVFSEPKIQTNDILSVVITASSPELAVNYNFNPNSSEANLGYLVTLDGSITLPVLGKIKVKDMTLEELELMLTKELVNEDHLTNPIVSVRVLNAKFTVLGEVNKPGTYNFSEQNISVLQALGYAGDLSIHGKRQDMLLIREEDNVKKYVTLDLTSKEWFNSPYYYIKPNDVIYVNPNQAKIKSAGFVGTFNQFASLISVTLSTVLTVLILTK